MQTKVSTKGQIVIPGPLRRRLGIRAGDPLDIAVEKGRIVLTAPKRTRSRARIIKDPITGFPVIDAGPDAPVLTSEMVRELLVGLSMRYLLDVNALIAYGFRQHDFHDRVGAWIRSRRGNHFMTCSITEFGFVRVLGNIRTYGMNVADAKSLLQELKAWKAIPLEFLADGNDISALPAWVKSPAQTTDGHLVQLASANEAVLATLMRGFQGRF